jgi:transcriptional regulator with XRE-family HTH domain
MTTATGSLVRRRQLGRQLKLLRESAGLTLESAAPKLDWSASKLSRIEKAQQAVDVHGLRSMLDLYEVAGDDWIELIALCRESRQRGWWRAYGLGDESYVGFEAEAVRVTEFALTSVPGLLQTQAYSRALFDGSLVRRTRAERRNLVGIRAIRQQRLTSAEHPVELDTVIDESVLHRPCGGAEVFAQQLEHLVTTAELPSVTLQVLPTGVGAELPITSGFFVLDFGDLGEPDMAYAEHSLGAVFVQTEKEVTGSRVLFDRLRSLALGPGDSVDLIRQRAARL